MDTDSTTKTEARSRRAALSLTFGFALLAGTSPVAWGQSADWEFEKVVDTKTPIPGGEGTFYSLSQRPDLDDGNVALYASGLNGQKGIYAVIAGSLLKVADKNTAIPGGTGSFTNFGSYPAIDGGVVVFRGDGLYAQQGVYAWTATGGLARIADTSTEIPGHPPGTRFTNLQAPDIDGAVIAFRGNRSTSIVGIYTASTGLVSKVADLTDPVPGGVGNFSGFGDPSIHMCDVSFWGRDASWAKGIYTSAGGSDLTSMADYTTPIPGGAGTFTNFDSLCTQPCLDNGVTILRGLGSGGQQGLYKGTSAQDLTLVMDKTTIAPGRTTAFTHFYPAALDGGNVAVVGTAGGRRGIYTDLGGELHRVVEMYEYIDGQRLYSLSMWDKGLSGNQLAFYAYLQDRSTAIYVATRVAE